MARTTTTTSTGTSTNRARMAASWGNTRYTNITAASRITLAASNPNAVISTGTIQIGLISDPRSLEGVASCVGPIGSSLSVARFRVGGPCASVIRSWQIAERGATAILSGGVEGI